MVKDSEQLAYSVEEAAHLLGIGRTHAYRLSREGTLPTVRLGARVVVPRAQLERLLAGDVDQ